jgi:FAD/FMN-containing dehydrogenase
MYSYEPATAWTLTMNRMAHVARPKNPEEVSAVLADATKRGLTITMRGAGYSYADEILNTEGIILSFLIAAG